MKDRIMKRFEAWLDEALAQEPPPAGIPAELLSDEPPADVRCDLYAMWSATTALTQEVKLQGRAFKQLGETLAPLAEEREKRIAGAAADAAQRDLLDALIDARERLRRGIESARAFERQAAEPVGWLQRVVGRAEERVRPLLEAARALAHGCAMSLDRVDEALRQAGVGPIDGAGEPFDPRRMKAVALEESADVVDGTVLEVYRTGYARNGEVLRPAEVKVARRGGSS